jgi:cytoskeletal protein CcmA (bactofilin family)
MSTFGKSLAIKGELRASEDLTVEGRVDGPILCEGSAVVIAGCASVTGQVIARNITVFGAANGQLIASGVVDVRADAAVTGQVIARRFVLDGNAYFKGRVSPERVEAALGVARFNQRQRDQELAEGEATPTASV